MGILALTLSLGWDVTRFVGCLDCVVEDSQNNLRLYDQAARIISISKLNGLHRLHT